MGNIAVTCEHCALKVYKRIGCYNRAKNLKAKLYCSQSCAGKAKQKHLTIEQKKEIKRLYDIQYRQKNIEKLKKAKKEYFFKDYHSNPEKYRERRKLRAKEHAEYCRQPAYKEKKHTYDRARYAKNEFGPFWESHVLMMGIREACLEKMSRYEIMLKNKTLNKALQRSRNGQVKRSYA